MKEIKKIIEALEETKCRSYWSKGVLNYALDIMADVEANYTDDDISNINLLEKACLNGASSWKQYSEGGCALIYDGDIAKALCTPSEYKKTKGGLLPPNNRERWIDVQSRALFQAWQIIRNVAV